MYTAEGSTVFLKYKIINEKTECLFARNSTIFHSIDQDNTGKYCIQVSKHSLDLQINNVTKGDIGVYSMQFSIFDPDPTLELNIASMCEGIFFFWFKFIWRVPIVVH